jgi:uncharacterized protein YjdB
MRALRRVCRTAPILILLAVLSCRDTAEPTGMGRIPPTAAALAVAPVFGDGGGDPVIPLRQARIRLFRLPGRTPEVASLDTLIPFGDEDEQVVTLDVTLTMANERFGMELALLDDRGDVVYRGRDTVIAYTRGRPPAATPFRLVYSGPDTAVARIALAPRDTMLAIGDALPLRVSAYLRDGRPTTARFGFAVHGSSAVTVDVEGVVRAGSPAAAGTAWVVARTATGLTDSVAVGAIVPARTISLSPGNGRLIVGTTISLTAVARDSAGAPLADREPVWRSANPGVATVSAGEVTGTGVGTTEVTATSGRATATAVVMVLPAGAASVVPSVARLVLDAGDEAGVSAVALDALGGEIAEGDLRWGVGDAGVVSVSPGATGGATATVRALAPGVTTLVVTIDRAAATIDVEVRRAPAVRLAIAPRGGSLRIGDSLALSAGASDARGGVVPASAVVWRSLSPDVASVDVGGVVRALAHGHVWIVATVDDVSDGVQIDVVP